MKWDCVVCGRKFPVHDWCPVPLMPQGDGFAACLTDEGAEAGYGSKYDGAEMAWTTVPLYRGPVCDNCLSSMLDIGLLEKGED